MGALSMDIYPGPTPANLACLPDALRARTQWVLWQGADRLDGVTGSPKLNKIPVSAHGLTPADTTDARTWGTYQACVDALPVALEEWELADPAAYRGGGLGYVLADDDPYTGIDLDRCIDLATGAVAPWAQAYRDALASYTEITPSGTGLHILVEGSLPLRGRRKGQVEMYDQWRFFTMTGWHLPETPGTVMPRQVELTACWCRLFAPEVGHTVWLLDAHGAITNATGIPWVITRIDAAPSGELFAHFSETLSGWPLAQCERAPAIPAVPGGALLADAEVISKACAAHNGDKVKRLASGQWQQEYDSQSEADLALCCLLAFWSRDPAQIDRLFRTTGLFRAKWDEARGAATYGQRTISEALARQTEMYTPAGAMVLSSQVPVNQNGMPTGAGSQQIWGTSSYTFDFSAGVSARDLVRQMMVPPRFLVDKLIPDGLTILAAPAKSYKSYFSLSLALATIGEGDWLDTFAVNDTGNVVFFGLESPPMQLRNRLHQLRPGFAHDSSEHELTFFSGMRALPSFKNGLQQALEQIIEHYTPRLIVIDPLSYLYRLGRQDDLASATLDLLWPLAEMAAAAQVSLLAPEHMRKRSKDDVSVVDQLAGSHIKAAIVHGLLLMHREGEDIVIDTTMRDAASQEFAVTLTFDETQRTLTWTYKGTMATLGQSRLDSMKNTVLGELKSRRYPMKAADLIVNCGLVNTDKTRDNVRQILHLAEKDGLLASSKRGEYYWIGQ
jgi:putative DNA primase/helicase